MPLPDDAIVQINPALHVIPYGDDEIFARTGSRGTYSRIIRDNARRRMLTGLILELRTPTTPAELRERFPDRGQDVTEVLDLLAEEEVIRIAQQPRLIIDRVHVHAGGAIGRQLARLLAASGPVQLTVTAETGSDPGGADPVGEEDGLPPVTSIADLADADTPELGPGGLIVLALDHLRPGLAYEINEWAADRGQPWMQVTTDGNEALIGPLVIPGETACYNCFDVQDESARNYRTDFILYKDHLRWDRFSPPLSPIFTHLVASWAALAIEEYANRGDSVVLEQVIRFDLERMDLINQRVLALPRCPVCSRARPDLRHAFL